MSNLKELKVSIPTILSQRVPMFATKANCTDALEYAQHLLP